MEKKKQETTAAVTITSTATITVDAKEKMALFGKSQENQYGATTYTAFDKSQEKQYGASSTTYELCFIYFYMCYGCFTGCPFRT